MMEFSVEQHIFVEKLKNQMLYMQPKVCTPTIKNETATSSNNHWQTDSEQM